MRKALNRIRSTTAPDTSGGDDAEGRLECHEDQCRDGRPVPGDEGDVVEGDVVEAADQVAPVPSNASE
jgi:hypothetical protein